MNIWTWTAVCYLPSCLISSKLERRNNILRYCEIKCCSKKYFKVFHCVRNLIISGNSNYTVKFRLERHLSSFMWRYYCKKKEPARQRSHTGDSNFKLFKMFPKQHVHVLLPKKKKRKVGIIINLSLICVALWLVQKPRFHGNKKKDHFYHH